MKLRGPPLWLVCDVLCWAGLLVSFLAFTLSFAATVSSMLAGRRRMKRDELTSLARLEAEQEAWLAYAIARRAFRLAGLKRSRVRFPDFTPARTMRALKHRASDILRTHLNIERITQRRAWRIRCLGCANAEPDS